MMQCSSCDTWVHAKCEGLTDEMYEVMSYLPEDITYHCPRCCEVRPPPWMRVIRQEMSVGISLVIDALIESKKAKLLGPVQPWVNPCSAGQLKGQLTVDGEQPGESPHPGVSRTLFELIKSL